MKERGVFCFSGCLGLLTGCWDHSPGHHVWIRRDIASIGSTVLLPSLKVIDSRCKQLAIVQGVVPDKVCKDEGSEIPQEQKDFFLSAFVV